MKKLFLFFLIQFVCATAAFAESPPWKGNGEAISARADLDVRWDATDKLPSKVWSYQLLPNKFFPDVISNLMVLCSFTDEDQVEKGANGIAFQSPDHSRTLSVAFSSGEIEYEVPEINYSPTNLAIGVPSTNQLQELAKVFLGKLHIDFSDIVGWLGTNKVDFSEPLTIFYVSDTSVTNVPYRTVYFRRSVDKMPIAGHFYRFNVGEHGKISKISIAWPKLKRIKAYRTISQKDVVNFLRKGNAIRGPAPTDVGDFDWQDVKSVTITKAFPSYMINEGQLYPFLRMDVTINVGGRDVRMAMDCPIIDETKL
jgi:hypothetical protein